MKIENITDVFFDLDHTLWDFDKNSTLTFNKIFKLNNIDLDLSQFIDIYKPINLKYWKLYREEKIEKEALRFGRLNDAFLAMNFKLSDDLIFKLSDDYIKYLTTFNHLFENTFEILNYLSINYKLHIITNGFEEAQHEKLSQSKIIHYFETITNSEMVGVKKPNPRIFNYALEQAGTQVDKSIMIGDSYEADILGAKNIGMDVIFFDVNNSIVNHEVKQINNLLGLKNYL